MSELLFVVVLRLNVPREQAAPYLPGHAAWLALGHDSGVFLLSGSLVDVPGGLILASTPNRGELDARLAKDPFVAEGIVVPEVIACRPGRMSDALQHFFA